MDRACPVCGAAIDRIDVPVNPRGGPRRHWAVPCGHALDAAYAEAAYECGAPPVFIEATTGIALMASERNRQRTEEGHTAESDAAKPPGWLPWKAWCYVDAGAAGTWDRDRPPTAWPDDAAEWRPGPTPIRNLVKAGALLAAEIDLRLGRGEQP